MAVNHPMAESDPAPMPRSTMPVIAESTLGAARFTTVNPIVARIAKA